MLLRDEQLKVKPKANFTLAEDGAAANSSAAPA
jgi:hypothetical protein